LEECFYRFGSFDLTLPLRRPNKKLLRKLIGSFLSTNSQYDIKLSTTCPVWTKIIARKQKIADVIAINRSNPPKQPELQLKTNWRYYRCKRWFLLIVKILIRMKWQSVRFVTNFVRTTTLKTRISKLHW
jgi:hypothetical protein